MVQLYMQANTQITKQNPTFKKQSKITETTRVLETNILSNEPPVIKEIM